MPAWLNAIPRRCEKRGNVYISYWLFLGWQGRMTKGEWVFANLEVIGFVCLCLFDSNNNSVRKTQ